MSLLTVTTPSGCFDPDAVARLKLDLVFASKTDDTPVA